MSLLKRIREDKINFLKSKNREAFTALGTLEGDARLIGMNDGNRETSDAEVIATIIKFLKGIDETLKLQHSDKLLAEKELLSSYLPKQLNEEELRKIISDKIQTLEDRSPKQMGAIMAYLKQSYSGQYDGNIASQLVKQLLV